MTSYRQAAQAFKRGRRGSADGNPGGGGGGGVDAGQSTCTATTPVNTGDLSTVTVTAKGSGGSPLSGQTVTFSVSGTNNTLHQPTATTDASGVATGTFSSTTAETKTVTAVAGGVTITQQPSVVVQAGATAWLLEDFSTYPDKTTWLADPRGIYSVAEDEGTANMTFETAVGVTIDGYNLTKSVRYDYVAPGCVSQTIERNLVLPSTVAEIWVELYCKWTTNFTTKNVNGCGTPPDFKMFFVRSNAGLGRGAIRWGSQDPPEISVEILSAVDLLTGTVISTYSDNVWHRLRAHWHINGSASVIQLNIDGTTIYNNSALNAGSSSPSFYGLSFARNLDQGIPSGTMSQWWGRIAAYNTDPGWTF